MADSLFAIVQSLAMTGVFDTIGEAMIAAGVVGGGIGGRVPVSGASYHVGRGPGMMVPAAVIAGYFMFPGV